MRGNGQGSVYRVKGRRLPWCATVTTGWTLAGRPVRRSRYAASRAEAVLELADMLRHREAGIPDDRLTIRAYLPAWLERRTDIRATTRHGWAQAVDQLMRQLGTRRVRHLTATDVEDALATMTPWTARRAKTVLSVALRDAERDGILDRNPARLARPPRLVRTPVAVPDAAACRALLAVAPTHRLGALVTAALGTGLRQGELLGLTRECLDLDAATLRVDWSLAWLAGEPVLGPPKSAESRRVVPLAPFVVASLRTHLAGQAAEKLAAGRRWRDADGLVFTTDTGTPVHPNTARYVLDVLGERAGIGHVRFHSLRHASLTLVTEAVGQKAAQALAGHARLSTTDIYTRPTDELERSATAALEEALG